MTPAPLTAIAVIEKAMEGVTPEEIAAAWSAWRSRHGGKLGPGPAFCEAIEAAFSVRRPAIESAARKAEALQREIAEIRKSVRNACGAIESNQVIDKDVHGTLTGVIARLDALLKDSADANG